MSAGPDILALFPGQGSQHPGMSRAFATAHPAAANTFDEASDALGIDMRALAWDAPAHELASTDNAQPALLTASVAAWRVLAGHGPRAGAAAGHSVGAVAALVATGRLEFADAVRLVRLRGELMAAAPGKGGMCAVLATGDDRERALAQAAAHGLDIAADNSPRQFVASGDLTAIEDFAAAVGARAKPLEVSHAFHSRLMAPAVADWEAAVAEVRLCSATAPVGLITTGTFGTDDAEVRQDLARALCAPVRWRELMEAMSRRAEPALPLVAVGPAKALVGLAKHVPAHPKVSLVDTPTSLNALLRRLGV
ncbi:ACP S-malonyltransferase [Streptomyces rimosus]|uniref:ACP S-malonyltransferase n=1 Tax=Streptomyces rimosus TaxID=1927 RepID=UPI0004C80204|nr:ACP S-malonyltransferase [Streptomyces rimosus]